MKTRLPCLFVFFAIASPAYPQGNPGVDREKMWPAPTATDWAKPCLVKWQRSYEDAVAVAAEEHKAILVCVNMDGEIASEHYAGIRYRDPEITKLYEPYVCVIASVYRHSPRDYDDEGNRIPCPRFGTVTCGEHIVIEPGLFEKFFDGKRIAPRHIMVELDGAEKYDVYYAWDTASVFESIRKGIADRTEKPVTVVRGDRPIVERVGSRDAGDRLAVETAYRQGDREQKQKLVDAALAHRDAAPLDLLRLGLFDLDLEANRTARKALAEYESPAATELIAEALRVPLDAAEREPLIAALDKIGAKSPRAKSLSRVHRGLSQKKSAIDLSRWSQALEDEARAAAASYVSALDERFARSSEILAGDDPDARLELAESFLARAAEEEPESKFARLLYMDAHRIALEAEKLGAKGWRVDAAIAVSASHVGELDEAYRRAESAATGVPANAESAASMEVLALFAVARQNAILKAVREKTDWPPQWFTDVHSAYSVLARHPLGTDAHVAAHVDFLRWLDARGPGRRALDEGLNRFPESWPLHERLRARILKEKGAAALEPAYETLLRDKPEWPNLHWFSGYASIVVAEFERRAGRWQEAVAAYDRAIAHYEANVKKDETTRETADHYAALALAGRARIGFETEDYERAVADLLASFDRRPDAAATLDGLNISAVDTAKMLRSRLADEKQDALGARIDAALAKLDPKLLELPAYEK